MLGHLNPLKTKLSAGRLGFKNHTLIYGLVSQMASSIEVFQVQFPFTSYSLNLKFNLK
jgi:hypothetical protein